MLSMIAWDFKIKSKVVTGCENLFLLFFILPDHFRAILLTVLKAENGERVELDDDQIRTPTYVLNTAKILETIALNRLIGKFNYCDGLQLTRFEIGQKVAKALGYENAILNMSPAVIKPDVIRPKNCFMRDPVLNSEKYQPEVDFEQHIRDSWSLS